MQIIGTIITLKKLAPSSKELTFSLDGINDLLNQLFYYH